MVNEAILFIFLFFDSTVFFKGHIFMVQTTLRHFAYARSGDKGSHANIGIIAYTPRGYDFLTTTLTSERVVAFLQHLPIERCLRYELPKLWAFNFLLLSVLEGGGSCSLRIDGQGKALGQALLYLPLDVSEELYNDGCPR